jgi:hypothetical protein
MVGCKLKAPEKRSVNIFKMGILVNLSYSIPDD